MFDWLSVLATYLGTQSTLTAHVGNRIWRNQVPQGAQASMPQKALALVSQPGGSAGVKTPVLEVALQARCYGANGADVTAVAEALYDVLHRVTAPVDTVYGGSTYRMFTAMCQGPGYFLPEPDTEWPCWIVLYRIRFAEHAVT